MEPSMPELMRKLTSESVIFDSLFLFLADLVCLRGFSVKNVSSIFTYYDIMNNYLVTVSPLAVTMWFGSLVWFDA